MYQGKYAQKKPDSGTPETIPEKPAGTATGKNHRVRPGGVLFYSLYLLFILAFCAATGHCLNWLRGWLTDFEAAQPTVKAGQIFDQLFSDPDWEALYEAAGVRDTVYEGKEAFASRMEGKVGASELNYLETSAGLSGDKKYIVRMGDEKIASFTLIDKNTGSENGSIGSIPDWQLGSVEVFFDRDLSFLIEKKDGHTACVNGVPLDDSQTVKIASTKAEAYLPEGTAGFQTITQQITGLMTLPSITVLDELGNPVTVAYDESTGTFYEQTGDNPYDMSEEESDTAVNAVKTYCLWMINEITNKSTVADYFDPSCETYQSIVKNREFWVREFKGYQFANIEVTDFYRYSEDLFSVRVSMDLNVTRLNGTIKTYPYLQSLIFRKNGDGKWLCIKSTNVDLSQPVVKVRLTFIDGGSQLDTGLYDVGVTEIMTPAVSAPEGKIFSGWATVTKDKNGSTVYNLVFQPDTTGKVTFSENTLTEPMVLYALFEDAVPGESSNTTEGA